MKPTYLGPRLRQLRQRIAETGLQRRMDTMADERHRRSAASLHCSDDRMCLQMGRAAQVRMFVVVWLALSGAAVAVWMAERVVAGCAFRSGSRGGIRATGNGMRRRIRVR